MTDKDAYVAGEKINPRPPPPSSDKLSYTTAFAGLMRLMVSVINLLFIMLVWFWLFGAWWYQPRFWLLWEDRNLTRSLDPEFKITDGLHATDLFETGLVVCLIPHSSSGGVSFSTQYTLQKYPNIAKSTELFLSEKDTVIGTGLLIAFGSEDYQYYTYAAFLKEDDVQISFDSREGCQLLSQACIHTDLQDTGWGYDRLTVSLSSIIEHPCGTAQH